MLDNGGEFSSPDLNEQKSNDSIGSDHLTSGKLIRHVMRYIKKKLRVISRHYHRKLIMYSRQSHETKTPRR